MKKIFSMLLFLLFLIGFSQDNPNLKLWYNEPSGNVWENALPIGNGFLGAMVYGNVEHEVIQLNENTVWSGGPNRNDNADALAALPKIRNMIFEGKHKEAEKLADQTFISKKSQGQIFQPVGNLNLNFEGHQKYSNYRRELDIEKAISKTSYKVNDVSYTREAFVCFSERVVVIHLTADKKASISFTANYSTPHKVNNFAVSTSNDLEITGTSSDHEGVKGAINFKGITRIKLDKGKLEQTDSSLIVKDADEVTIYVSIATNFNNYHDVSGNQDKKAADYMDRAFSKSYERIKKSHIVAYQQYFNRVKFNLGQTPQNDLPTDVRLKNFRDTNDPQFVTLYYQYGRYLLISSSQPGGQPANLQGIWNNNLNPAWDSKYTININAQMNYWPAEKTNLSELHEPFLEMVKDLAATGQETARTMYGARGWMAHHNTDIWRSTGAVDGAFWGLWTAGGGWASQHLWEHYLYTGDKEFLKSIYPILKGAALFYVDFLVEHPLYKWLVVNPGNSPENAPKAHNGSSLDAGTTMDNQIVYDVFTTAIRAAAILKEDAVFVDTLQQLRSQLPPMKVGKYNQLQEWLDDIDDPEDHHRHVSHLYGLFPSNQIGAYKTPELFAASKNTLMQRGDVSTGWSMGWKINWWAKLQDGNHAYLLIKNQLTPLGVNIEGGGTYNNLFDAHPPFQIDGNFGCTSGITEMLVQSSDGAVHLLPALPDLWQEGSIKGIRVRGGFEIVEMKWENYQLIKLIVKSELGGNLRLRMPNNLILQSGGKVTAAKGENPNPFYFVDQIPKAVISEKSNIKPLELKPTILVDVATKKDNLYRFVNK
ncbi:glycoside hydrolase N-terminal domain-containing protein [Flavobacterium sp. AC]|uniref:Glycoside hydrolase N-terminal domain-containing protein n=1 Tax=Flavobacterium azizsancarii TaxID=2961580 RepID=A0ABT4WDU1_9FLAO|nr:glycoside hydrolase N-terminal domain-containing protein [Flavobacterium azizsancarii]MDA6070632.1 glycoside hydrolase N-terminal domain-containing protein [Flavobacterium azizsancarii]